MHHLVIVRHAKSDWNDASLTDHDRPLAPRGRKALGRMRDHLVDGPPPDLVLCSSARRTIDTLAGIRAVLPDDVEVHTASDLYGARAARLVARLQTIAGNVRTAMVVGHNPGVHDLALALVGSGGATLRTRLSGGFPTGAIATLSIDSGWADLEAQAARLDRFFTPREG